MKFDGRQSELLVWSTAPKNAKEFMIFRLEKTHQNSAAQCSVKMLYRYQSSSVIGTERAVSEARPAP
jgi:hypothetical protein